MKKTLILLASAALLFVGCAKEQVTNGVGQKEGGLQEVTFTANLESGVATKAAVDGDGAAANVNRCIMEIYYDGERYTRQYAPVDTDKKATFTVQVPSNRTYKVAFWADCIDTTTEAGLAADGYYTTNATGGLQAITINGSYIGNDDARDAFFHVGEYTVAQAGSSWGDIKLYRPFAQMNVITTDWDKVTTVDALKPEKVNVAIKNALVAFNALTGEASGSQSLTYEAAVYTPAAHGAEKTLSMDYLFAPKTDKAFIDIDWKARKTGDADVEHAFAAVPYQRNYRTNIKGALLTTQGQWTVTVDPIWENDPNGDFDYAYTSVYDIQGANDFVAQNKDKKEISVTFSTQPNDAGNPSEGTPEHPINAIVTSLLKEGAIYNIDVASTTGVLYVGDYDYNTTPAGTTYNYNVVLEETSDKTNAAAVNLVVTDNLFIGTLVVNSPSKSVSINGQTVQSGKTYHIQNLQVQEVSMNTVIIEKGMVVENLEMVKGGLEIHGTVHKAIVPDNHGDIAVRDCENLDETLVYNVLKDYIADGYVGVKGRTTAGLWDIIPWVCKIGTTGYGSLADAVAAVPTNGSETTITMVNDFATTEKVTIAAAKNVVLDLNGKKISYTTDGYGSFIENRGQLKIKDSGSTGIITAKFSAPNWNNGCYTIDNFGASPASKLVIESGTIENTSPAGLAWPINNGSWGTSADLVINGGTIHSVNYVPVREYLQYGGKKTIVINGGKLISDNSRAIAVQLNDATVADQGSYVEINGGEFSCNGSGILYVDLHAANLNTTGFTMTVNGGKFKNANADAPVLVYDNEGNDQSSAVLLSNVLKGGVYSKKPADEIVADKYVAVANEDAAYPWKVQISPDAVTVARIGTKEYYSLSDALSAAKDGEAVYIIPNQLEETVNASNDNNIQLILDGKNIIGDITFGGKGTLIVRAEELNTDYYHASKAYDVEAPTIPAQGVGGIMGKISATETATVMLRENLYSGPFEGKVELRGGFYYSGLGLDNIKAQTPGGIGLVVEETQKVQLSGQEFDMYYVPEVPESYLVHFPNVAELMTAYIGGQLSDEQINQITFGYGLGERIMQPLWLSVNGGDNTLVPTGDNYFPDDVYAFFTNLRDGEYDNPKYAYQDWLCDYVISYSEPIKKDYQSGIWGYYSNMSIGCWLPSSVTQAPFAMLSAVNMKRSYSQMLSDVGMFLCGPVNLNPEDTGIVITVNLNIYPDSETKTCITTNKVVYTIPAISE